MIKKQTVNATPNHIYPLYPLRHPPQPNDFCKKSVARWHERSPGKRGIARWIGDEETASGRFDSPKGGSIVAAFTTLLRQYGNRKRTVDFYAKRLGLTKNYFCMVIKRET